MSHMDMLLSTRITPIFTFHLASFILFLMALKSKSLSLFGNHPALPSTIQNDNSILCISTLVIIHQFFVSLALFHITAEYHLTKIIVLFF